jgi:hypothetical protein
MITGQTAHPQGENAGGYLGLYYLSFLRKQESNRLHFAGFQLALRLAGMTFSGDSLCHCETMPKQSG